MSGYRVTTAKIGDIAKYIRGITFKPDDKVAPGITGAVVCMRTKNIQEDVDESDLIAVPKFFVKRNEQFLRPKDILVSSANSWNLVGKCAQVASLNYEATAGGFIAIVRPNSNRVDPDYLYRWLAFDGTQRVVRKCARQTTNIANLAVPQFLDLEIPLPPLAEQQRIAGILGRADRLRRLRRYALDLNEGYLQAVFLEMFGDPVQTNPTVLKDLIRENPKNGLYLPAEKYGMGIPIIRINNFYDGVLRSPGSFKRVQATQKQINEFSVSNDEILINRVNSLEYLGKCALVRRLQETTLFESNMMRLRVNDSQILPYYLVRYLSSVAARLQILQRARKAVNQASINQTDVKSIVIPVPSMASQRRFVTVAAQYDFLRAQQSEALRQAEHLFQALLQRAFHIK